MTTPSPTVDWAQAGTAAVEGTATSLGALSLVVNQAAGGGDALSSIFVSGIPVGATFSDGVHSFTATSTVASVNVTAWNLSNLSIKTTNDVGFTLTATALSTDGSGNLSAPATATQTVDAPPLAPGLRPVSITDVEGAADAIYLFPTLAGKSGDANSYASIRISAIPVGAVLTDGTHAFTATLNSTSVDIVGWSLTTLKITPPNAVSFTLQIAATERSAAGVSSATTTATEAITVKPLAPTLAPVKATGVEGSPLALSLGVAVNNRPGDANTLSSLVVSAIPIGVKLSDGTHAFTSTGANTSVDIASWSLSKLTLTSAADANIALGLAAIETSGGGVASATATATETVVIGPKGPKLAPATATGVEKSPIALHLGLTITQSPGDANTLASLIVGAIPVGATLSDGIHAFTARGAATSVDIAAWSLATLTFTPANDVSFALTLSATERSAQGALSAATTAVLNVKTAPVAPGVTWGAPPAPGVGGEAAALGTLATTIRGMPGDASNRLASLGIGAIPIGDTLSDGTRSFTATSGATSTSVLGWSLAKLTLAAPKDGQATLIATAQEKSLASVLGPTASVSELVVFAPPAPGLAPGAAGGVEGSAISLNLGASLKGAGNSFASIWIKSIPVGAALTDGVNSFVSTAGSTAVNVASWALSSLTIAPPTAADFTLSVTATEQDGQGAAGPTASASLAVSVAPLAPSLAPAGATGVEGSAIALTLAASPSGRPGDANSLSSLNLNAIPLGAVVSDGAHVFTAVAGSTSVNVLGWALANLTVTPANAANFTLTILATEKDADGEAGAPASATLALTVLPAPPRLAPVAETGVEGAPIALSFGAAATGLTGDANTLASLVVSAIPVGATLTDGTHAFTAAGGDVSVDVHAWSLSSLRIIPAGDGDFVLGVSATEIDANGEISAAASASEAIAVTPLAPTLAPVAAAGVEGAPIALSPGLRLNSGTGDANALASLVVSAIPVGATLGDGTHAFTATPGHTSVDIAGWALSALAITPAGDANFTLGLAATETDGGGDLSVATTASQAVAVAPLAPGVAWAPAPSAGVEGAPVALGAITASINSRAGETNALASLSVSGIPVGATLGDGANSFTATAGHSSVNVLGWSLATLSLVSINDANVALTVTCAETDADGDASAPASAVEAVTLAPLAPGLAPVAAYGLLNTATPLNLGASVAGLAGDANALASLWISAIPIHATLTDDAHTFTASANTSAINVVGWALSKLTIVSASASFTLGLTASERDAGGAASATVAANLPVRLFAVEWNSPASGGFGAAANWITAAGAAATPTLTQSVLIDAPVTVTHSAGPNTIAQLFAVGPNASVANAGGTLSVSGVTNIGGGYALSAGTAAFGGATTLGSLTQSGGALTGAGAVTVTGSAVLSNGYETGATTTTVDGGAAFVNAAYALDGGRNLQLGGSTVASGTDSFDLNGANPNSHASVAGAGTLTILAGAVFDDATAAGVSIFATNQGGTDAGAGAAVDVYGTFENTGGGETAIGAAFDTMGGTVDDVSGGGIALRGGGADVDATYIGAIDFEGARTVGAGSDFSRAQLQVQNGVAAFSGAVTLAELTLGDDGAIDSDSTVTVSGTARFGADGDDSLEGSGTTTIEGGATFTGSPAALTLEDDAVLALEGASAATGTTVGIDLNGAGTLTIASGATFNDESGGGVDIFAAVSGASVVDNAGEWIESGGGTAIIAVAFVNTGTVSVQAGTLDLAGGGASAPGAFTVASGATLEFGAGATFKLSAGTLDIAGNLLLSGDEILSGVTVEVGGSMTISGSGGADFEDAAIASFGAGLTILGGALDLGANAVTVASLTQSAGDIDGAGVLTVTGPALLQSNVDFLNSGSGTTLLEGATTFSSGQFELDGGRTLENTGVFDWTGGTFALGYPTGGGTISNAVGGLFDIEGGLYVDDGVGGGGFVNAGTLEQTGSPGSNAVSHIGVALTNTGAVSVQAGTLQLGGGGQSSASAFAVANGALLAFDGGLFKMTGGAYDVVGATEIAGGEVDFSAASVTSFGATLDLSAGLLELGAGSTTVALYNGLGGDLDGAGTVTISGAAYLANEVETGAGTTIVSGTTSQEGAVNLDGGRTLQNAGVYTWQSGAITLGSNPGGTTVGGGTFVNAAGATLVANADNLSISGNQGPTTFDNVGTWNIAPVFGLTVSVDDFVNTGAVTLASYAVVQIETMTTLSGAGSISIGANANLALDGAVDAGQTIGFASGSGTLALADPSGFAGAISGFGSGDVIDLLGVSNVGLTAALVGSHLAVSLGGAPAYSFALASPTAGETFMVNTDNAGGATITVAS